MNRPYARICLLFALLLTLCGCGKTEQAVPVRGVEFIMNTFVEQNWYGENAAAAYEEIAAELRALEDRLTLHRPNSEVLALNHSAGVSPVVLSTDTFLLLQDAIEIAKQTDGSFDISIAPLSLLWDVTADNPRIPTDAEIASALSLVDYRNITLDPVQQTAYLEKEGMAIDLGGIAKGMAAQAMREVIEKHDVNGFLSIGGNMLVRGKKPDGSDYRIGVRDPNGTADQYLGVVTLDGYTMATTGDYERFFEQDGVRYHHVLDPATGRPSNNGLRSVTVIAKNGTLGDGLSTAIFIDGIDGLDNYLNRTDCLIIAVTNDNRVLASPGVEDIFTLTNNSYTFVKHD